MRLLCMATVPDEKQRQNLCECIQIIGGKPNVIFDEVFVEYDGPQATADKFIELFSQYPMHGISTIQ